MEKFKICPICGTRNKPSRLECIDCETDLTNIKPIDEDDLKEDDTKENNLKEDDTKENNLKEDGLKESNLREDDLKENGLKENNLKEYGYIKNGQNTAATSNSHHAAPQPVLPSAAAYIRICDCGAINTAIARTCTACGEDISDIAPVRSTKDTDCRYVITSLDGACQFEIPAGTTTIGREHELQGYLRGKPYVSRRHARLTSQEGAVFIENLSTTNYTFVNNRRITAKTELKLHDEIGLGGSVVNGSRQTEAAYFRLEEPPCT